MTDAYLQNRDTIYAITRRFAWKYRFHFNDLLSAAHKEFVRAFDRFHSSTRTDKAALSSWIYFNVTTALMSFVRKEIKHHNLPDVTEHNMRTTPPDHFLFEFQSELSQDARSIIQLILDAPEDLITLFRWNSSKRGLTQVGALRSIQDHLETLGWTRDQVKKNFHEIIAVLNGQPETQLTFWEEPEEEILHHCGFHSREDVVRLCAARGYYA